MHSYFRSFVLVLAAVDCICAVTLRSGRPKVIQYRAVERKAGSVDFSEPAPKISSIEGHSHTSRLHGQAEVFDLDCSYCVQVKGLTINEDTNPWGDFPAVTATEAYEIALSYDADGFVFKNGRVFLKKAPFTTGLSGDATTLVVILPVQAVLEGVSINDDQNPFGGPRRAESLAQAIRIARDAGADGVVFNPDTQEASLKRGPFDGTSDVAATSVMFGRMARLASVNVNPDQLSSDSSLVTTEHEAWDDAAARGARAISFKQTSWVSWRQGQVDGFRVQPKDAPYVAVDEETAETVLFGSSLRLNGLMVNYGKNPYGTFFASCEEDAWSVAKSVGADGYVFSPVKKMVWPKQGPFAVEGAPSSESVCMLFGTSGQGVCQASQTRCSATSANSIEMCSEARQWGAPTACPSDQKCSEGFCVACVPGEQRCINSSVAQSCLWPGQWKTHACDNGVCDDGACVECLAGSTKCAGANSFRSCLSDNSWSPPLQCDGGKVCSNGACISCVPGASRCPTSTSSQSCSPRSDWLPAEPCGDGRKCTNGVCACKTGAKRCDTKDSTTTCGPDGQWGEPTACPASQTCQANTGDCAVPKFCPMRSQQKTTTYLLENLFFAGVLQYQYDFCSYVENDPRGFTAGFRGFSTCTSTVYNLVKNYTTAYRKNPLAPFLSALLDISNDPNCAQVAPAKLPGFCSAWATEAKNAAFQKAQQTADLNLFYRPSQAYARQYALRYALSQAVLYSIFAELGGVAAGMESILAATDAALVGPPTVLPKYSLADEVTWLRMFLSVREDLYGPSSAVDAFRYLLQTNQFSFANAVVIDTSSYPALTIKSTLEGAPDATIC